MQTTQCKDAQAFLYFLLKKKYIFFSIVVVCALIGAAKSMSVQKKHVASFFVEVATMQDLALLNYNRSATSAVRWLTPIDVFSQFRNSVLSKNNQKKVLANYPNAKAKIQVFPQVKNTFKLSVSAQNTGESSNILKSFLEQSNATALQNILKLSNKVVAQVRKKTEKEILRYQTLINQIKAKRLALKQSDAMSDATSLILSQKNDILQKKIVIYQQMLTKHTIELATMTPLSISPDQINLYHLKDAIALSTISAWPQRIKIMSAYLILGLVFSLIILLLMFLYDSTKITEEQKG